MKNYARVTCRRSLPLLIGAVFLLVGLVPALAMADSSKLTAYLPSKSELVVGLNIKKLRSSKYYSEALVWARETATDQDFLKVLENDADVDLSTDLDALVLSIPEAKGDPSNPNRNFTMAATGDFDKEKLIAGIGKNSELEKTKKGKRTVYSTGEFEFTFLDDGLLWVTAGPESYRKQAWKGLADSKQSLKANKMLIALLEEVDTTQGFWMLGDTSDIQAQGASDSPQPQTIGMSMDISKGLKMKMLTEMPSEADAKSLVEQVAQLKKQSGSNPMMSIVGAGPLVANLTTAQEGTKIRASTQMTAAEFDTMVRRVKQLAQSQGANPATPSQPVPSKSSGNSGGGADADFN